MSVDYINYRVDSRTQQMSVVYSVYTIQSTYYSGMGVFSVFPHQIINLKIANLSHSIYFNFLFLFSNLHEKTNGFAQNV